MSIYADCGRRMLFLEICGRFLTGRGVFVIMQSLPVLKMQYRRPLRAAYFFPSQDDKM